MADKNLVTIGWREWLSLPDIGIPSIKAKIDTGARTSALHTHDYEIFTNPDGTESARFHLHPRRHGKKEYTCIAPVADYRTVRDSGGHPERRPFIETTAQIGAYRWRVLLSLTNRETMLFRMLLGRTALENHFLVDVSRSYLIGSAPPRKATSPKS